jgi:dihydrofolate synthase/folylpolyglutamate synthase
MNYEESVQYMSGLLQFGIRLDRERFIALLERLGNPQNRFGCIHIAGTNGKGSTTTFIAAILRSAGYRVGTYLSPYVFDMRERIQINGIMIPREEFARWVTLLRPHIEALAATELGQTTEFELKTAVAFAYFAESAVDFAAVEVGIGGRLDATNVIPPPLCAVITSIGWDHMHLLGDTLGKIAFEKAGILKTGSIAVTAVPPGEAKEVIDRVALEKSVPLYTVAPEDQHQDPRRLISYQRDASGSLTLRLSSGTLKDVHPSLRGTYQAGNAATAVAAVEILRTMRGVTISDTAIREGLGNAFIPGRFQMVRDGRPTGGATLLLDGAHNVEGAETLGIALRAEFGEDQKYTLITGAKQGHAPGPFLEILAPLINKVIATRPSFRPVDITEVVTAAERLNLPVSIVEPATSAILETWRQAKSGEVVVVTGSLYLVGETPEELRH